MWGNDKPAQKRESLHGEGWLRSPNGSKVVRIRSSSSSRHAAWCEVSDADRSDSGQLLVRHHRRMLRFNAQQLWHNLIRQGWSRCGPQW
jgi:hypothetical protein